MQRTHSQAWIIALFPLLLSCILFLTTLTDMTLWADEGWTIAATATPNPLTILEDWVVVDVHPPLYFVLLSIWRIFTGDSVFEMRYFSVLVVLLGVAMIYRLGVDMFNRRTGFIAALLFALHDLVRVLTQEVRHYSGQLTITIVVLWLYWRFQQKPTRSRAFWFVAGSVVALYIHYWTAFIILACGIHALITYRNNRQALYRVIVAGSAIVLLFGLWVPTLIHQITQERPQGLPHALENTLYVYQVLLYQLLGTPEVFWVILMGTGFLSMWIFRPFRLFPKSASWLLVLAVITPPLLTIVINMFYPILSLRALAVVIPPTVLLASYGLSRFRATEGNILLFFIVLFSLTNTAASAFIRPDWRSLADMMTTQSTSSDSIFLENNTDEYALAYYIQQTGRGTTIHHSEHVRLFTPDAYPQFIDDALANSDGVWVAVLNWSDASYDIRRDLTEHGFQQSAPELDYGLYDDRPILLWRFDRIPEGEPLAVYGDLLNLHRVIPQVNEDTLTVNMLWSASEPMTEEYTTSIVLLGALANYNQDKRPAVLTSTWTPDDIYFDNHVIDITDMLPGTYQVAVQVYAFTDDSFSQTQNLATADCSDDELCRYVIVGEVVIPE